MKVPLTLRPLLVLSSFVLASCDSPSELDHGGGPEPIEIASEVPPSPEAGEIIIAKLEEIIIPVVDFENTHLEEAIDYLRIRSMELDEEGDLGMRGVSILIRSSKDEATSPDGRSIAPQGGSPLLITRYYAENISILEALTETCRIAQLDAHLTSVGIVICSKGGHPFPNSKARSGEIWKKLTE